MDEHEADELFRRALIDADASAAVALRVVGLPLCEALTVVFHGRRDLGTIQTYVAHGGRGAGQAVAADELLRVPCDLDLAAAERPRGGRAPLRRAGGRAARRARGRRHRARHLARAARGPRPGARRRRPPPRPGRPAARAPAAARRARGAGQGHRRHRRLLAAAARGGRARRWGSPAPSRTSREVYPLPDDPERCLEDFLEHAAEHARRVGEQLGRQEQSVRRFLELSGEGFEETA